MTENLPAPVHRINGRRNLVILGVVAVLIALTTTGLELWIYRSSGDIYLDRSRPGFLPDAEESAAEKTPSSAATYHYSENGPLNSSELAEYLEEFEKVEEQIKKLDNPYSPAPLSDASLGI